MSSLVPYEFCTLFDREYVARAVVLARSLAETCSSFRLHAYCMDAESYRLLGLLGLPGVVPVALDELERDDPGLAAAKRTRRHVEYLWTATPAVCLHAFARAPEAAATTYLDADLMLFNDPRPLFEELGERSILLTPHLRLPDERVADVEAGRFVVQFLTFRRDASGLAALEWWRERCLEWCRAVPENGRFGDQRYLDDWPERFAGVHVLEHPGALTRWNVRGRRLDGGEHGPLVDGHPVVFFHYSALGLFRGLASVRRRGLLQGTLRLSDGPLPLVWQAPGRIEPDELELLWEPYLARVGAALAELRALAPGSRAGVRWIGPAAAAAWALRRALGRPPRRFDW